MDFTKLPLTLLVTKKMAWLSRRSQVLAENVANADSPGFKARDLKEVDFRQLVARETGAARTAASPTRTHRMHLTSTAHARGETFETAREPEPFETTISGNTVNLEQQMAKIGETQLSYQLAVDLYRKQISMFKTALGRGSG